MTSTMTEVKDDRDDRPLLIFDLDGTVIHPKELDEDDKREVKTGFIITTDQERYHIRIRPGVPALITWAQQYYRLAVWSASPQDYVDPIVEKIFHDVKLEFVFAGARTQRMYSSWEYEIIVIKPLNKVWQRKTKSYSRARTLIVDDTPSTFSKNYGNGIPIRTWRGDKNDKEITRVMVLLDRLKDVDDVRHINKRPVIDSV